MPRRLLGGRCTAAWTSRVVFKQFFAGSIVTRSIAMDLPHLWRWRWGFLDNHDVTRFIDSAKGDV